ncbi:MAG: alpha-L-rhamnosidase, partial [Bacteroidota bacterium]|nr:alpha-L-rhamnosidase [Bacteroidota bacterium]
MKQTAFLMKLLVFFLLISSSSVFAAAKTEVKELVCEYQVDPMGIDVQKPRLSWQIVSAEENLLQTAYEIKVTDQSPKGKMIWTSGKVNSDNSVNVAYDGS